MSPLPAIGADRPGAAPLATARPDNGIRRLAIAALAAAALLASPGMRAAATSDAAFDQLTLSFIHAALAQTPVAASDAGYHLHRPAGSRTTVRLDSQLDQVDASAIARRLALLGHWQRRFAAIEGGGLDAEQETDLAMLRDAIEAEQVEIRAIRLWQHNPAQYVELLGDGLFRPMTQDYAAPAVRLGQALDRVAQIPRFLAQARSVLESADPVFVDAAHEELQGVLDLVEHDLAQAVAGYPALRRRHARLAPAAAAALRGFDRWQLAVLAKRPHPPSWRIGMANYQRIFALTMEAAVEPRALLVQAEQAFAETRADLFRLALAQHAREFPEHGDHAELSATERANTVIHEVLDRIGDDHVQPADLLPHIQGELDAITGFIRDRALVSLGDNANLKVIATPEFQRASYSVAGFSPPPPLDPAGEAQYWVTPIDPGAPAAQSESRLREYNNQTLRWMTIHEALPGHYVQFEHANRVEPRSRRLLRAIHANGAYVEGWAEYIAQTMMDGGYQDGDPRFRIMMRKIRLRLLANTILDIRLHCDAMSDDEALQLMTDGALQTAAEASGKLRRAKLSHVQLATYYVGLSAWQALRRGEEARLGAGFDLRHFHDQALDEGPVPLERLGRLLAR